MELGANQKAYYFEPLEENGLKESELHAQQAVPVLEAQPVKAETVTAVEGELVKA